MLEKFTIHYKAFLNRSTVIYGASGSGKTTIIKDILFNLREHVDQAICFCPSDVSNHSYSSSPTPLIPDVLIHSTIQEDVLIKIRDRQIAFTALFNENNKLEVLHKLYRRFPDNETNLKLTELSISKKKLVQEFRMKNDPEIALDKVKELNLKITDAVKSLYREAIKKNKKFLETQNLSEEERNTLKMIHFKPGLVLILDDVTTLVEKMKKCDVLNELIFQGRHWNITPILALHSDTAFSPTLRDNTNNTIFADKETAYRYYDKKKGSYSKDKMKLIKNYIETVIKRGDEGNTKLVFLNNTGKYYYYEAKIHKQFTFGSPVILKFNTKVRKTLNESAKNNAWYKSFIY